MRRAWAFAVRFVLGAVAIWVAYVVIVNVVLVTGLGKTMLNRVSPHLSFEWSSASSTWFARFDVRDFAIRGDDAGSQWRVTVDDAHTAVDPWELLHKKVHLYDVHGRGVTVRLRRKIDPAKATPDYLAKLPEIPGLPGPPLKPAFKPPAKGNAIVQMTHIDARDVREVWIDTVHVNDEGARAEGSFLFSPAEVVHVRAAVHARDGAIQIGKSGIVARVHGGLGLHIHELNPRDKTAAAHFDVEARATGIVADLSMFDPFLARHDISLHGGGGPAQARVEIVNGVVQPKSHAEVLSQRWTLRVKDHAFSGTTIAHALVRTNVAIASESYGVDVRHKDALLAHAPLASTSATLSKRDLGLELGDWAVAMDVPSSHVDDVRALDSYLGKPLFRRGSARASLHANVNRKHASGRANVDFEGVTIALGKAVVNGNGTAHVRLRDLDLDTGAGSFSFARAEVRDVAVGDQRGWWAHVTASPFELRPRERTASRLVGDMRDGRTPLEILGAPRIAGWLVGDDRVTASADLHTMGGTVAIDQMRAEGKRVEVRRGEISKTPRRGPDGSIFVSLPLINILFSFHDGHVDVHPFATKNKK